MPQAVDQSCQRSGIRGRRGARQNQSSNAAHRTEMFPSISSPLRGLYEGSMPRQILPVEHLGEPPGLTAYFGSWRNIPQGTLLQVAQDPALQI
jgi:hypothetical protein